MNAANSAGDAEDSAVAPWSLIALTMSGLRVAWRERRVQLGDRRVRRAGRRDQPEPGVERQPGETGLRGGRDLRQHRHALFAR